MTYSVSGVASFAKPSNCSLSFLLHKNLDHVDHSEIRTLIALHQLQMSMNYCIALQAADFPASSPSKQNIISGVYRINFWIWKFVVAVPNVATALLNSMLS